MCFVQTHAGAAGPLPVPPVAAQVPHRVASPHGVRVDEYHWLRDDDPQAKRPEVMAYLAAENAYAEAMLVPLQPLQQQLLAEMRSRVRPDEGSALVYDQGWWTWRAYAAPDSAAGIGSVNSAGASSAEYPQLWRQRGGPAGPDPRARPELLLDQPARAAGHAYYKVGSTSTSPDGRTLAWTEDTGGRRVHTLHFKDLRSGELRTDRIDGVLEEMAWANDSRTIFYVRQDPVAVHSGPIYRHRLGTLASADIKVYDEADKTLFVDVSGTASRRYLLINVRGSDTAETWAIDADRPESGPRRLFARRPGVRHQVDHLDGRWVIRTNEGAPDFKLVAAPGVSPDRRSRWRTLVPPRPQVAIEDFALFGHGAIALQERIAADTRVRLLAGSRSRAVPAAAGTSVALVDNRDPHAAHVRYAVTSMVQPQATYDLDRATGVAVLRLSRPVPGYDPTLYETTRLWAPARDGQRIPVTLAWRRDKAQRDGRAPLLMMGYGAYGLSYDPEFSSARISLLDRGFVVAIAHVRGGAELGQAWFEDGRLLHKFNTFNDFIDATNALLAAGWGAADQLYASGGSAGGLLMGVVANQSGAPGGRCFRGIALDVPFVDVVTTMLDETMPLVANEWTQWGDPRDKAAYDAMLAYSPYDNLRAQDYPAMLVTTGLWDSQVQYHEPAKYVARLRARKTGDSPLLLTVNMAAGHGGASGRYEALAEAAREFAFFIDLASPEPLLGRAAAAPPP